jgi:hypothetical protein
MPSQRTNDRPRRQALDSICIYEVNAEIRAVLGALNTIPVFLDAGAHAEMRPLLENAARLVLT